MADVVARKARSSPAPKIPSDDVDWRMDALPETNEGCKVAVKHCLRNIRNLCCVKRRKVSVHFTKAKVLAVGIVGGDHDF